MEHTLIYKNVYRVVCIIFFGLITHPMNAQLGKEQSEFTRKDSLRGMLTPPRTCYDVHFYHLDIKIDPDAQSIEGANTIHFEVLENTDLLQVDLFENMSISSIRLNGKKKLKFDR